jgi:hypothetical protein
VASSRNNSEQDQLKIVDWPAVIKNWIICTHAATQCSAIRRLNEKRQKADLPLLFLGALINTSKLLTGSRHEHLATASASANDI